MLTPTLWLKFNTVFPYFKPLKEVTSLYFLYEHGVYKNSVALHNQAQFHLDERGTIVFGILVF